MSHIQDRRPEGRGWRARYRGPDGREYSMSFDRKTDAESWLEDERAKIKRGEWTDPALGKTTFGEWLAVWEKTTVDLRPSTRARDLGMLRNHIEPRFGPMRLSRITLPEAQAWIAELSTAGHLAPASVRKAGSIFVKVMSDAVRSRYIARSPAEGLRLPSESTREMLFLGPDEIALLVDAVEPDHYRALVYTAVFSGLRWGELAGLRPDRVDLLRRSVRVDEQLTEVGGQLASGPPKTTAGRRTVSIPRALVGILEQHLGSSIVQTSGLVFPSEHGQPMRRSNFRRRVWRPAVARAGLEPGLRFHDLRHTAVALAIAQGAHPSSIQQRMGHASITTTLGTYGHLFPSLDEKIAEGLEGVLEAIQATVQQGPQDTVRELRQRP